METFLVWASNHHSMQKLTARSTPYYFDNNLAIVGLERFVFFQENQKKKKEKRIRGMKNTCEEITQDGRRGGR